MLSYQIAMPSYSTEFENLEHKDVERWKNHATPPLIRFLPEWRNNNDHGAPTQQSTLLKVEPKSRASNADTYKFSYALFEDGDVEDLIRFLDAFEEISNNKPLATANSKFAFFKTMLTGAALEKWNQAVHDCTRKPEVGEDGTELGPPGQTEETFLKAKVEWKTTYFQTDSLYLMHEYLRSGIKFPVNKGILVKDWVKRLTVINSKLSRFPKLKHWDAKARLNLDNEEVKQIITRACPISWQTKLQLSGKSTYQHTIESLTTFLDAVQRDMAEAAKSKQSSQKEKKT